MTATQSLGRLSPRELCRRLHLEGWESLHEVAEGQGAVILLCPPGEPEVAAWALGLYAGPLYRALETPSEAARRFANLPLGPGDPQVQCLALLRLGSRIALPWLSPRADVPSFAARLAWESGSPLLPVQARMDFSERRRWLQRRRAEAWVQVHPPLQPGKTQGPEELAGLLTSQIAAGP